MKKKLLALVLCFAVLISAVASLSACSSNEDKSEAAAVKSDGAKTITMWVVTENEKNSTDENGDPCFSPEVQEAMDKVEKAFSKVTKSKFKTNVDIRFLTAEEYYGKLESAISYSADRDSNVERAQRALKHYIKVMQEKIDNNEIVSMDEEEITERFYIDYPEYWEFREGGKYISNADNKTSAKDDEYIINDLGVPEIKYPDAGENQVDIFYLSGDNIWKDENDPTSVSGYDRFMSYIKKGWLADLDENLDGVGANIKTFVSPVILNGTKHLGVTYAIPNNTVIGEYTYMLIDKETYDKFGYGKGFNSSVTLLDCESYLSDIAGGDTGLVPIDSTFEETMSHFVWYWDVTRQEGDEGITYPFNKNGDSFSIFGSLLNDPANNGRGNIELGFNNILTDTGYQNVLKTLKSYDINGYYGNCEDDERAAISYITGGYGIKKSAENNSGVYTIDGHEYYVSVVKYPEIEENDLYGNMFAICSASKNSYACMEVLTALNTESQLRNILQYGILPNPDTYEKGHYNIDEDTGVLRRIALNDAGEYYSMDINKTGNCFVAHPEEGLPENYWDDFKKQNGEAIIDPLLGFDFKEQLEDTGATGFNVTDLNKIASVSASVYASISGARSVDDLKIIISELAAWAEEGYAIDELGIDMSKYANKEYELMGDEHSMYAVYYSWLSKNGYAPATAG